MICSSTLELVRLSAEVFVSVKVMSCLMSVMRPPPCLLVLSFRSVV